METDVYEKPLQIWQVPFKVRQELRHTQDPDCHGDGGFPPSAYLKVWDRMTPAADPDHVHWNFQRGTGGVLDDTEFGGERIQMHSLSVGDVIILEGCAFRRAPAGWDVVTSAWVQAGVLPAVA